MVSPESLLDRARNADSLGALVGEGIGGILLSLATIIIAIVLSLGQLVTEPIGALGTALGNLVSAMFGGAAFIVNQAARASGLSLGTGFWQLGPLTFPLGVGVVLLTLWLIGEYRAERETGNLIPGLPFDVPYIGQDEEGSD